ncbi:MAG: glycosyltransferase [Fusobacteriaceae bacterium]
MNLLFLSHRYPTGENELCLEKDFIKALASRGHKIYVIAPLERRFKKETYIFKDEYAEVLFVKTGNRTKEYNLFEKIFTILTTPILIKKSFDKYFGDIKIDNIVSYTPFMSNYNLINYLKKKLKTKTTLFLWDIMPQTAKDMGIIKNDVIFKFMKNKEKKLYNLVDKIVVNCDEAQRYILNNNYKNIKDLIFIRNPEFIQKISEDKFEKQQIKEKFGYKKEDFVFVFGGNMGMLQNLDNLLDLAKELNQTQNLKFLLIGDGKDKPNLEKRIEVEKINNIKILDVIPKLEYDRTIAAFEAGLIVLSEKNSVPNFPTKVTAYLKLGMPMFGILDKSAANGVGEFIIQNRIGNYSFAGDLKDTKEKFLKFTEELKIEKFKSSHLKEIYKNEFDVNKAVIKFEKEI